MKIKSVKIKNFRGFREEKIIDFNDKSFVLLYAPNGVGKTSIIDAIEWCFTGNIGRLKNAYDKRSSNNKERKANINGILKNKNANRNEYVEVELTLEINNKICKLKRMRKEDKLDIDDEKSEVFLNDSTVAAEEWIEKNIDEDFYNYHFCDIQKSFDIQSRSRKSLTELFKMFISNYDKEKQLAENLKIYQDDIDRRISDLIKDKVNSETIEQLKRRMQDSNDSVYIGEYPKQKFYKEEETYVNDLKDNELDEQIKKLKSYGYTVSNKSLQKIKENEIRLEIIDILNELVKFLELNYESIKEISIIGYKECDDKRSRLLTDINKLKSIKINKMNYDLHATTLLEFKEGNFTFEQYQEYKNNIQSQEKNIKNLEGMISDLTKNNKVLDLLSSLVAHKSEFIEFRESNDKCPVCGSDLFKKISEEEILSTAKEYVNQNNSYVAILQENKTKEIENLNNSYKNLLESLENKRLHIIEGYEKEYKKTDKLLNETKEYFIQLNKLKKGNYFIDFNKVNFANCHDLENLILTIKNEMLSKDEIKKLTENYQNILSAIGFNYTNMEVKEILARVDPHINLNYNTSLYNHEIFTTKLNVINSIKNNLKYKSVEKEYNKSVEKNKKIDKKVIELEILKSIVDEKEKDIINTVHKLEKEEYEIIGPFLKKYYKKLSRIETIEDINVQFDEDSIILSDEKKKNIVNILSSGQLSVFMLSYFFASITVRSETEKCKIYFLDDLTSCMDDINMLSFLDLMKYQMKGKNNNIEQLFFVTCDSKISSLLEYKMKGSNIDFCEITEEIINK